MTSHTHPHPKAFPTKDYTQRSDEITFATAMSFVMIEMQFSGIQNHLMVTVKMQYKML